jgi:hypothetical protein
MTKNKHTRKKYGLLPPKIAESDPWVMVSVDMVGPFTIRKQAKIYSLLELTMIDPAINTGWFEIVEATNKSATSITPGWQITRDLNLLSLTMGVSANSNMSSYKCV